MKRTNPVERCIQYTLSLQNGLKMETFLLEIEKLTRVESKKLIIIIIIIITELI